ncbi:MAG: cyclophilin-type peptidylprolyl cis-trans isomerase [Microgenomates bacterium 39_6]|nr:MAG: cyclophilin-type peptidylprolyl cis-trans isomerase [Microgenomates bacterium 39_6]
MKKQNLILGVIVLLILVGVGFILKPQGGKIPGQSDFFNENLGFEESNAGNDNLNLTEDNFYQEEQETEMENNQKQASWSSPPPQIIDPNQDYLAVLTTSVGQITIDLLEKKTPMTVNNFVFLANEDFYKGVIFHRVIEGFMIQGGCPRGDGTGGPGYQFPDEPFEGQYTRGTVAMANAGPNTNGSQFFIMHQDYQLASDYVIFGQVVEGMEIVDKIASSPVKTSPNGEASLPVDPVTITNIEIITR